MLIVNIQGGLGNQLFQYAFGKAMSQKRHEPLLLDISYYSSSSANREFYLNKLNIKAEYADPKVCYRSKYQLSPIYKRVLYKILNTPCPPTGFSKQCLHQTTSNDVNAAFESKHKYYDGFWQSAAFLNSIDEQIRQEFCFEKFIMDNEFVTKIEDTESVCLHVRRTDYLDHACFGVCSIDYYLNSIDFLKNKLGALEVFIFSDDIEWCKSNIKPFAVPAHYVQYPASEDNTLTDMALMIQCKHYIISNSSFAWWGAWLSKNPDKIVIAPKKWFSDEEINMTVQDLIPGAWFRF